MANLKCIACNNTKSDRAESSLEGDALDMFNFVCCLEIDEPGVAQGICNLCHEELTVSFNFKKRCLEIFANIYDESNENQNDDEFGCLDSLLDQTLHEDENSFNLNDLLIPEVCLGNSALSVLDVSDNTKCRYCFLEFSSKEECLAHMEVHKGNDKPYQCPHQGCDSSFKARKNLKDHYLVHSNERPFPCHFCEQTFKSSSNRSKHERRIHSKERNALKNLSSGQQSSKPAAKSKSTLPLPTPAEQVPFKIEKEPVVTVIKSPLQSSSVGEEEDRIYKCDQDGCPSSFKTRSSLRDHQKVHSEERPYPCAFCSSAFKSSSNRSKHERGSHPEQYQKRKLDREAPKNGEADGSPLCKKIKIASTAQQTSKVVKQETVASPKKQSNEYPCRYCDRVLTRADNRDKHEATHKDIRAFDCGFCSKNFKTQEALRAHTKIHTEPAKLSCSHPGCKEVYQDRRSLKEHESSHLDDNSIEYVCEEDDCGKVYTSPKALRNHKKMKHNDDDNDEISCDICTTSFRKSELADHLRIHI